MLHYNFHRYKVAHFVLKNQSDKLVSLFYILRFHFIKFFEIFLRKRRRERRSLTMNGGMRAKCLKKPLWRYAFFYSFLLSLISYLQNIRFFLQEVSTVYNNHTNEKSFENYHVKRIRKASVGLTVIWLNVDKSKPYSLIWCSFPISTRIIDFFWKCLLVLTVSVSVDVHTVGAL